MRTFLADERGATSIEYAMIAGAICVAIVAVLVSIGPVLQAKYAAVLPGLQR